MSNAGTTMGCDFRGSYTWSSNLDTGGSIAGSVVLNAAMSEENPYNPHQDWGKSPQNITNQASGNFGYDLPFGPGKRMAQRCDRTGRQAGRRLANGYYRNAPDGFSFSPLVGSNRSGNGDNSVNPDRPNLNAGFSPESSARRFSGLRGILPAGTPTRDCRTLVRPMCLFSAGGWNMGKHPASHPGRARSGDGGFFSWSRERTSLRECDWSFGRVFQYSQPREFRLAERRRLLGNRV